MSEQVVWCEEHRSTWPGEDNEFGELPDRCDHAELASLAGFSPRPCVRGVVREVQLVSLLRNYEQTGLSDWVVLSDELDDADVGQQFLLLRVRDV